MTSAAIGPWQRGIDPAERRARLRCFRALVLVYARPFAAELIDTLRRAESDDAALDRARTLLDMLPALHRRRVWASYGNFL